LLQSPRARLSHEAMPKIAARQSVLQLPPKPPLSSHEMLLT
jgi:hypothetical protein